MKLLCITALLLAGCSSMSHVPWTPGQKPGVTFVSGNGCERVVLGLSIKYNGCF